MRPRDSSTTAAQLVQGSAASGSGAAWYLRSVSSIAARTSSGAACRVRCMTPHISDSGTREMLTSTSGSTRPTPAIIRGGPTARWTELR